MTRDIDLNGIEDSQRPIFFCSFGKDSSVLLHALRPWLKKILVVFVDCGGLYPDIVDWAKSEGAKLPNFFYLHTPGDIWASIKEKGWPVDIETEDLGELSEVLSRDPLSQMSRVRLWTKCTRERFWMPSFAFAQMYQADLFISGEKRLDRPYAKDWDNRHMGTGKALRPLMEWSDQEVWDYIDDYGIQVTKTFQGRQDDRRDCYVCFGHNLSPIRVEYLKMEWPDLYRKIFYEMGFKNVVDAMVNHLTQSCNTWIQIQGELK